MERFNRSILKGGISGFTIDLLSKIGIIKSVNDNQYQKACFDTKIDKEIHTKG